MKTALEHDGHKVIKLIKARLSGHIVTMKCHPFDETSGELPLSVEGQVLLFFKLHELSRF